MKILNYSDLTPDTSEICKTEDVILDLMLYDIPATMRRNIKICSKLGARAVTVSNHCGNAVGIEEAIKCGEEYEIEIILRDVNEGALECILNKEGE